MENKELEEKIKGLYKILLGMNAVGTLDLSDIMIIEKYIQGSFGINLENVLD